jgi:hypothetical protein
MFPGIWRSRLPATEPMRTAGGNESINIDFQVQRMSLFKRASAISRHDVPEVLQNRSRLDSQRAQGKPGAQCTRSLVCKKNKHTSVVTTGSPETARPSLRNGFTAYFVLFPVTMLC